MTTLIVDIKSEKKAKELSSLLSDMKFVKRVSIIEKRKKILASLEKKKKTTKRKNKETLLSQIEEGLKDVALIQSGKKESKSLKEILNEQ
jgi:hypothetical protein